MNHKWHYLQLYLLHLDYDVFYFERKSVKGYKLKTFRKFSLFLTDFNLCQKNNSLLIFVMIVTRT